ncbi:MAG: serine protease [Deltaproteobacteria bacterium]|nr:serine protease [Deltaproteobacteria bacterium]
MRPSPLAAPLLACTLVLGCGGAPPAAPVTAAKPAVTSPLAQVVQLPAPKRPERYLDRTELHAVLREGPATLLELVPIEEVLDKGAFVGWRVLELPLQWQGAEIEPGDVVTAVNGMPIEKPPEMWAAWTTLSVASELKIAYQREGEKRVLAIPIVGEAGPAATALTGAAPAGAASAPAPRRGPTHKPTIVIGGEREPAQEW